MLYRGVTLGGFTGHESGVFSFLGGSRLGGAQPPVEPPVDPLELSQGSYSLTFDSAYQSAVTDPDVLTVGETYDVTYTVVSGPAGGGIRARVYGTDQPYVSVGSNIAFTDVSESVSIYWQNNNVVGTYELELVSVKVHVSQQLINENDNLAVYGTLGEGEDLIIQAKGSTNFGSNELYGALNYQEQTVGQVMDPTLVDSSFTGGGGMVYDDGRGANKSTTVLYGPTETRTSPHIPMPNPRSFIMALSFRNFDENTPWPGGTGWPNGHPEPGVWPDDSFMKLGVVGQHPNSLTIHGTQQHLITCTFNAGTMAFGSNLAPVSEHYLGTLGDRVSHFDWNTVFLSLKVGPSGGYGEDGSVNSIIINEEFGYHKASSIGTIQSMDPDPSVIGDGYKWFIPYQWWDTSGGNLFSHVLSDMVYIQAAEEMIVFMNSNTISSATKLIPQPFATWAGDRVVISQCFQNIDWQGSEPLYMARLDSNLNMIGESLALANPVANTRKVFRFSNSTLSSLPPKFRTQNTAVDSTFHIANYTGANYLGYVTCSTYNELKLYRASVDADNHFITTYASSGSTINVDGSDVVTPVDVNSWLGANDNVVHTINSPQEMEYIGTRRTGVDHRAYFDLVKWVYTHESAGEHIFDAEDCVEIPNGDGTSQYRWYNTGAGANAVDADYGPNAVNIVGGGSNDNAAPYYEFTAESGSLISIPAVGP